MFLQLSIVDMYTSWYLTYIAWITHIYWIFNLSIANIFSIYKEPGSGS